MLDLFICGWCEQELDDDFIHYCPNQPLYKGEADKWLYEAMESVEK